MASPLQQSLDAALPWITLAVCSIRDLSEKRLAKDAPANLAASAAQEIIKTKILLLLAHHGSVTCGK